MSKLTVKPPAKSAEYQRFEDLTRKLFSVPKKEVDEKEKEWKKKRENTKRKTHAKKVASG